MKTPRELLFEKHRAALPKLDAVREHALETIHPTNDVSSRLFVAAGLKLWRELILPSRHFWTTAALAWVAVIAFNMAALDDSAPRLVNVKPISREAALALRAKEQELARFIDQFSSEPAEPPPSPRSERKPVIRMV